MLIFFFNIPLYIYIYLCELLDLYWENQSIHAEDDGDLPGNGTSWWTQNSNCVLLKIDKFQYKLRIFSEVCQFVGAIFYLLAALMEAKFLGYKMFIENLVRLIFISYNIVKINSFF